MRYYLCFALLSFCATSCTLQVKGPEENKEANSVSTKVSVSNGTATKIRNDIQLETLGSLKVSQAFLVYEDGKLVSEENKTEVGKPVDLRLIIDKGWQEQNGKVSIGASERIETSDGQVLLFEEDLFKEYKEVEAKDARYISLTANISRLDKLYDYFLVSFRVWDKKGTGEAKGSYKLYIQ